MSEPCHIQAVLYFQASGWEDSPAAPELVFLEGDRENKLSLAPFSTGRASPGPNIYPLSVIHLAPEPVASINKVQPLPKRSR